VVGRDAEEGVAAAVFAVHGAEGGLFLVGNAACHGLLVAEAGEDALDGAKDERTPIHAADDGEVIVEIGQVDSARHGDHEMRGEVVTMA
jgi:hypothetical protein